MHGFTNSTCAYGLSPDAAGACVITLASYCRSGYRAMQYGYIVAGLLALLASTCMYGMAWRHQGSRLQKRIFLLCIYISITFLVRAIDIKSYDHILPRAVSSFFNWSCTDALITILVFSLTHWMCLVQSISVSEMTFKLKLLQNGTIASVWIFNIAASLSAFQDKGFGGVPGSTQLFVSAALIAWISTAFLFCGLDILWRLHEVERKEQAQCNDLPSLNSEPFEILADNRSAAQKPSRRICKVLILTELVSTVTIAGQLLIGWNMKTKVWIELECANGFDCDKITMNIQVLHCVQVCLHCCQWSL